MSPLLFNIYIDELLHRLSSCHLGCHIGTQFHGAYSYADDVIVLAPSLLSLRKLLDICQVYALEYNVMFNPAKSKLIAYSHNKQVLHPEVEFMGSTIEVVLHDKHSGNYIGHLNQSDIVSKITNDFLTRVNMVKHHFKRISIETMYFLFKTYGMPRMESSFGT